MELRKLLAGSALATLTVASLAPIAKAQPVDGLYVGAGAGLNMLQDTIINPSPALGTPKSSAHWDAGWRGVAAIGYGFAGLGLPIRVEIEGDYFNNHLDKVITGAAVRGGGYEQKYGAMANLYYDIDTAQFGLPLPVFPYVGIGVGWLDQQVNGFNVSAPGTTYPQAGTNGADRGSFAYQAIAGLAYPIVAVPGLSATVEYRFTGLVDPLPAVGGYTTNAAGFNAHEGNVKFGNDLNHSVLVGLRYAFNVAPPPPPPPAPAPVAAPARSYLVFFDWDKANLTERARQIIREAADNSTKVQYTRIEVNGYTDTSGTPRYNQGLSVRRAQAVAAELVRDGVPRSAISIQGFGETHLLVPTGPGVREPQNRRVEIIIQ